MVREKFADTSPAHANDAVAPSTPIHNVVFCIQTCKMDRSINYFFFEFHNSYNFILLFTEKRKS